VWQHCRRPWSFTCEPCSFGTGRTDFVWVRCVWNGSADPKSRPMRGAFRTCIWRDFGSALPFQTRLTQKQSRFYHCQTSTAHRYRIKVDGSVITLNIKKFLYLPTRDASLLTGHGNILRLFHGTLFHLCTCVLCLKTVGRNDRNTLIWYMIYVMIYLTATGLTPGGSSTSHIYVTQTIYIIHRNENLGSAGRAPSLRVILLHLPYDWGKTL
jgi:hypothetical protein